MCTTSETHWWKKHILAALLSLEGVICGVTSSIAVIGSSSGCSSSRAEEKRDKVIIKIKKIKNR
ncbi:hypothetical protein HYX11_04285 [Candidatus Woesearchaeota archaeon]|nr:hypothetical protein [Candidatus Woesearchaeota archaeon]